MKTIIAKYPGRCFECGEAIKPGDKIKHYGRLHNEHVECSDEKAMDRPADEGYGEEYAEDLNAGLEPGTLASDRRSAKRGISVFRFSSGAVMTQNSKGRCEDAPCCGCCS